MGFWEIASGLADTGANIAYSQIASNQQFKRQQELMRIQMMNQKELNAQGQQFQKDMWNLTNYKEQKRQMEMAGLNPALLYGKSGGGGATTGNQGGGSASGGSVSMAPMMGINLNFAKQQAEIDLLKAQKENLLADAESKKEDKISKAFDNSIREKYRNQIEVAKNWEWTHTGTKSEEEWKAWQIRKQVLYGGDADYSKDKPTPYEEQLIRDLKTSKENLQQLVTKGDILGFEKEIEKFKSDLAKNGISPDSPWYAKLITDLLEKVGLGKAIRTLITQ